MTKQHNKAAAVHNAGNFAEQAFREATEFGKSDPHKSVECFIKADELGHERASLVLFAIYSGQIDPEEFALDAIEKDDEKALKYLRKAVDAGHADAFRCYGFACLQGEFGLSVNHEEAIKHFKLGAMGGDMIAQRMMGGFYYFGSKSEGSDASKALHYLKQAAEQGDAEALFLLGVMYGDGFGVSQDYSVAFDFYTQAASRGHLRAFMFCADLLYAGLGVKENPEEAVRIYHQAAEEGSGYAMVRLARTYTVGRGAEKSEEKAHEFLQKALAAEEPEAFMFAAVIARNAEEYEKARDFLQKAHDLGELRATELLSDLYLDSRCSFYDVKKAIELLELAMHEGSAYAPGILFLLYDDGKVVEQRKDLAEIFAMIAVERGNYEAGAVWLRRNPGVMSGKHKEGRKK